MLFNSLDFLVFFPIVTLVYFVIPRDKRYIWLLLASYYFYMGWNPKYAILIGTSTLITYFSGIWMERSQGKYKRLALIFSLLSNLGILALFKYANFFLSTLNALFASVGLQFTDRRLDLLLPVGISFYTFQALGYTFDVHRGETKAERNLLRYALFVSFFPQLVAGPIERSNHLLRQVREVERMELWEYDRIRKGFLLMAWGYFQKLVIADRISILVDQVYNDYSNYGFLEIAVATVLFAFQIYCDFGGYSDIARDSAMVMGFELMKNFRQPYLAFSIHDFWRRWHISLTSWFTDYLYIPLGGNRKGLLRKYANIFIVFAVSGLWHGASWHFVAWGMLHAVYQIFGDMKFQIVRKIGNGAATELSFSQRLSRGFVTFGLVDAAWFLFAVSQGGMHQAYGMLRQMSSVFHTTNILGMGLSLTDFGALVFGLGVLGIVDILHEQGISVFQAVGRQTLWFRWGLYLGLIWATIMLGVYGAEYSTAEFIYFQF